jgi:hypothetical protein
MRVIMNANESLNAALAFVEHNLIKAYLRTFN